MRNFYLSTDFVPTSCKFNFYTYLFNYEAIDKLYFKHNQSYNDHKLSPAGSQKDHEQDLQTAELQ